MPKSVSFTDPYAADYAELARQQKMAELLSQQAAEPIGNTQMVSGWAVPQGPLAGLNKVAQSALSAFAQYKTGEREKMLAEKIREGGKKDVTDFMGALQGTPAKSEPFQADTFDETDQPFGAMTTETPAVAGDRQKALAVALGSGNPMVQSAGSSLLANMLKEKEYGTSPVVGADGKYYLVSKTGEMKPTDLAAQPKASMSSVGKLISERDQLPPDDPRRQLYDQAISKATTHQPGVQVSYGSPVAGVDATGNPVFFQPDKGGGAPSIIPGVTPAPKVPTPPTGEERSASGYLGRMKAAEKLIGGLAGGEPTEKTSIAGAVPFVGDYAQRKVMTDKQQQFKQATDDWIRAKLRKESGAVIGDIEMKREYQTYFPQPGDSAAVVKQKAQARKQAEEQMKIGAGRAYKPTIDDLWE